jgi:Terminase large subunit, T4likevirus-type, N-terminal
MSDCYRWQPATAAQQAALDSEADILFFGGSAGSLKTETMLMDAVQEYENPHLRAIIFRQTFAEMTDLVDKTQRLFRPLGGEWVGSPKWKWTFPSGASIRFAYMRSDDDVWKYLGPRYSFIGFDESTLHTEKQVRNILGRLSSTDRRLRLRVRLCSNPGNVGASWHQELFLRGHCPVHSPNESAESGKLYHDRTWPSDRQKIPFSVAFIPGKLSDHNLLDADYAKRLRGMAGDAAARMELGCWCSLSGAYFSFLNKSAVKPLADCNIEWWHNHFIALDYGLGRSSAAAGLYVRSPAETTPAKIPGIDTSKIATSAAAFTQGRIRKIGEILVPDAPVEDFAKMVVDRFIKPAEGENPRRIIAVFLDPANFNPDFDLRHGTGGHSISDQIDEVLEPWGLSCQRGSNQRVAGWQLLYRTLRSGEFEITDACPKTYEGLRTRMHDEDKPGDIAKVKGDPLDDICDETRYALFSFIQPAEKPREAVMQELVRNLMQQPSQREDGLHDLTSLNVRYQQRREELDRIEAPIRMGSRLGLSVGLRRR